MPEETKYIVTSATLVDSDQGSMWKLTLTPSEPTGEENVVITVPPSKIDYMFFDETYTREEIAALDVG